MAITVTSTGSDWKIASGTDEEVANYLMGSSIPKADVWFAGFPVAGSTSVIYHGQ